jgi:glutathione S-transferase
MTPTITAFERSPDRGKGLARDMRVRWALEEERLPILEDRVRVRLGELSTRLGDADWLDGAFSAGDLLMVTVLRRFTDRGYSRNIRTSPPMSPVAKRGPPTRVLSTINWRFSPASH